MRNLSCCCCFYRCHSTNDFDNEHKTILGNNQEFMYIQGFPEVKKKMSAGG